MQIARAPQLIAVAYKPLHRLRIATARVLGDVHDIQPKRNRILDGLLSRLQKEVVSPSFRESADRTRSNKGRRLDRQPSLLHDLGDRPDIVLVRTRRTVRLNLHLVRDNFARQRSHGLDRALARSRQAEVERIDPQRFHQMKDFNLFRDRRIAHRRRLQTVAQALVIEQHRPRWLQSRRKILVPVVDEVGGVHQKNAISVLSS